MRPTAPSRPPPSASAKPPVEVNDAPGFVSNRILLPMINEAIYAVMEGVATPEAVDEVFKLGMAHPMGPLTLADFIGLDVCLDILRVLHSGLGRSKVSPLPAAHQNGRCRMAWPQVRPRLLQIRVADFEHRRSWLPGAPSLVCGEYLSLRKCRIASQGQCTA